MHEVDPLLFIGMGITAFAINFLGTYEIQKIQQGEAVKAAAATAANVLLANTLLYFFVQQPIYGIAEAVGAFGGTFFMIHRNRCAQSKIPLDK